ncbi:MAG: hypothetical protein WAL32_11715 [Terriglobales bacterium]
MRSSSPSRTSHPADRGYILITLILFVALLAIALTALAPVLTQQIKRDREEELIHRGTQYSRAIQHYVKKFSRYPTRIEDLEDTNEVRFLRKRYKDPITGKDFKLLHMGEVQISGGATLAGATSAANLAAGSAGANGGATSTFGGSGVFGGNSGSAFGGNSGSAFGGNSGSAFGGNSGGASGGNSGGFFGSGSPGQPSNSNPENASGAAPNQDTSGASGGQNGFGQPVQSLGGFNQQGANPNQVIGGGPIVGVASTSKEKSIRVFSKKEHYNEWQFIYDPTTDRGGLITTPYQTSAQVGGGNLNGTPGANGTSGVSGPQNAPASSFNFGGQNSGFGGQNSFGGASPQPSQTPQQAPQ